MQRAPWRMYGCPVSCKNVRYGYDNGSEKPPTSWVFKPEFLKSNLYNTSSSEVRQLVWPKLNDYPIKTPFVFDGSLTNYVCTHFIHTVSSELLKEVRVTMPYMKKVMLWTMWAIGVPALWKGLTGLDTTNFITFPFLCLCISYTGVKLQRNKWLGRLCLEEYNRHCCW